jgi:hypothetical protein
MHGFSQEMKKLDNQIEHKVMALMNKIASMPTVLKFILYA